jgi:hypothetical protein
VRRYGLDRTELGAGGQVGVGMEAGVDVALTRATSRLLDAWTRPGGGAWERRLECVT